ncbi:MAG TPA: hypothetical protein VE326_11270 [Candidatus Binatia bacterium]|nr:hypothetical protein [Candidatus Binatia bacterium]
MDDRIDLICAALDAQNPNTPPMRESTKQAIRALVDSAPPMTNEQVLRVGRILRGSRYWPTCDQGRRAGDSEETA